MIKLIAQFFCPHEYVDQHKQLLKQSQGVRYYRVTAKCRDCQKVKTYTERRTFINPNLSDYDA